MQEDDAYYKKKSAAQVPCVLVTKVVKIQENQRIPAASIVKAAPEAVKDEKKE